MATCSLTDPPDGQRRTNEHSSGRQAFLEEKFSEELPVLRLKPFIQVQIAQIQIRLSLLTCGLP